MHAIATTESPMASPTLAFPPRPERSAEDSGLCVTVVAGKGVVVYLVVGEMDEMDVMTTESVIEALEHFSKTMSSLKTIGSALLDSMGYLHH